MNTKIEYFVWENNFIIDNEWLGESSEKLILFGDLRELYGVKSVLEQGVSCLKN